MYITLTILIVILAIILVLAVLVQNSKGGGLASGFQSSNQILGVRKTTDFIEKATWSLVGAIVVLSIVAAGVHRVGNNDQVDNNQIIQQNLDQKMQQTPGAVKPDFSETPETQQTPVQQQPKK
ncbi:MAG: preprotein translocase subunit SecG [Paludibacter sp.]|nr:preprotein translocase subunit SecG [Paludibacter sp.]